MSQIKFFSVLGAVYKHHSEKRVDLFNTVNSTALQGKLASIIYITFFFVVHP